MTGTKGKSTVSALIAHFLRALGRRTALAGNIGLPLLDLSMPPAFRTGGWSSFRVSRRALRRTSTVGVINNLYEEHLDWHGTRERYAADKLALADAAQTLVVNAQQAELMARTAAHPHRLHSAMRGVARARRRDFPRANERVLELARSAAARPAQCAERLRRARCAGSSGRGRDGGAGGHVATFAPLPHRLQTLGDARGFVWIDDSIATTPQATIGSAAQSCGAKSHGARRRP